MLCPRCRQPNPPAARFCSNCGANLAVACPACGSGNAPGSRFCNECGEALSSPAAAPRVAPESYTPKHLAARILTSRGALEGERKQVTVLFADLKGSMELLAERDPEEARHLLDPVLERMMEAVHHYEGTVNQVMGDGIMALFGAPLAHEDHALRACYAALRMQERVRRYGDEMQRAHGVPIQIRVGLNSGDVLVRAIGSDLHMDYSAVGQTTHLAARMEQMAKPDSVLLTAATLRLVEGHVRVKSLGPVAIKGLGEPVEVLELTGLAATRTRLQVAAARGLTRFVGRDGELEQLRIALERARAGHGQVVAIVGEPGVGKSRLVWELAHSHRTADWVVLESSSVSYGKATTFLPVIDLLRAYFGVEDRDDPRRVREKLIGKLLALDEALRPSVPALEAVLELPVEDAAWASVGADQRRRRVIDAVKHVLLRESQTQPLLVIFEDLHWVDGDTQALLDALVESVPSHRLLLLVNYRPEYRHGWGGKSYYQQLRLDPLGPETAESLLASLLGTDPTLSSLRSVLIERAQGNPLFLEESVRALSETGVLAGERGTYRLARSFHVAQMPATVQAILAARIDRLPPEDKALLQTASVIGKDVPLTLLQAITVVPENDLMATLERLQSAEFLYETQLLPDAEYTFKHALTHEVAYASLVGERRRALHASVVDAIERLYPDRLAEYHDRLVHHSFRGEIWNKALTYLRELGEVPSVAEIDQVIGMGPENPGQLWWAGEHERAVKAAERDMAVGASFGNFSMRVVAGCRLAQAHHALGKYGRAVELFRQTVGLPRGRPRPRALRHGGFSIGVGALLACLVPGGAWRVRRGRGHQRGGRRGSPSRATTPTARCRPASGWGWSTRSRVDPSWRSRPWSRGWSSRGSRRSTSWCPSLPGRSAPCTPGRASSTTRSPCWNRRSSKPSRCGSWPTTRSGWSGWAKPISSPADRPRPSTWLAAPCRPRRSGTRAASARTPTGFSGTSPPVPTNRTRRRRPTARRWRSAKPLRCGPLSPTLIMDSEPWRTEREDRTRPRRASPLPRRCTARWTCASGWRKWKHD